MMVRDRRIAELGKMAGSNLGLLLNRTLGSRARGRFGILMYHRIAETGATARRPTWNVTPSRFREQLRFILSEGYQVWPLQRIIDYSVSGRPLPERVTALTFDDGYENVFLHAWPILRELGAPATIFVVTGCMGSDRPFPFDRWGTLARSELPAAAWRPLSWAQCRELQGSGLVSIGSHTHTHGDFRGREELFRTDLEDSLASLRSQLGARSYTFSFPYGSRALGSAGEDLMMCARAAGVTCALTTDTGLIAPGSSPFGWGRFEVTEEDTGPTIISKLEGWYNWTGPLRELYRVARRPGIRVGS
jgi:peptidoglycan/xylan/chitin deacetylase (PgdA/CDA1 family)